jgi:predicted transcriptional regulator
VDDLDLVKMHIYRTPQDKLFRLSKDSGIPYSTLWNIKLKNTKSPRYDTVKKLASFYKARKG